MRHTKIIGTIGPACRDPKMLGALIAAGLDVVRLNFSHGTHDEYGEDIAAIREFAREQGRNVAILADLQGPKIRIGTFKEGRVFLHRGNEFTLTTDPVEGTEKKVFVSYEDLPLQVKPGTVVYLADGMLILDVIRVEGHDIICSVIQGGELSAHKGVNVPGIKINEPSLTDKDKIDLDFAISKGVDWVALSFVRDPQDLIDIKAITDGTGIRVMAKIEKREAVESLAEIIAAADGIMVARGDLGVEVPIEEVPLIQRHIVEAARISGKPVVIATQMLDSMTRQPLPTRAETTDVAHAIYDGTDAVMLSNETAVGSFPLEAVKMAGRIAETVERDFDYFTCVGEPDGVSDTTHAISRGACEVARQVGAKAIITPTQSGETARQVGKHRTSIPVIAVGSDERVVRQLAMSWGVAALYSPPQQSIDKLVDGAVEAAKKAGAIETGDKVVITAGVLVNVPGTTNMIEVHEVG